MGTIIVQLNTALAGRYELLREIGAGGMATVYLARDVRHDRNVALKVLNPELGAVLGAERFLAEIQTTARLQHPNVLPLFDSGEADGLLYYVMPYVEGVTLRGELAREKQLPVDEAVRLATAIAGALDYSHRHGVIHRDLKPENILLHEGQPLVADFGIALAVSRAGGARITQTGLSLGTPQYMSPEQATGDRAVDGRSDIYSLGAMTYEMLTGDPPHTASSAQAVIAKVITDRPRSIRAGRPAVPEHVEAAIERALEKMPADRWRTASEFADALGTETPRQQLAARLPPMRWRTPIVLGGLVVLAGAVAIPLIATRMHSIADAPVIRFTLTTPSDAPPFGAIVPSPDGRVFIYPAATPHGPQLYARTLDQTAARPIAGTEGAIAAVFSPDGRWIAFVANGKLKKMIVDGGPPIAIADVVGGAGMDWSPDNVIVLGQEPTFHGLLRVSADGGQVEQWVKPDVSRGANLAFDPIVLADRKTIVFTTAENGSRSVSRLAVASLDGSTLDTLAVRAVAALGVFDGRLFYVTVAGTIAAAPFDEQRHRTTGRGVPVMDGLSVCHACMGASLSRSGTLVFPVGGAPTRLSWLAGRDSFVDVIGADRPYAEPRLSPDGRSIAFGAPSRSGDMYDISVLDVPTGTVRRLTSDGEHADPAWAPDGKHLLFVSSEHGNKSSMWWQIADGSSPAERLTDATGEYSAGVVAPNGHTMLLTGFDGHVLSLDTLSLAGDRKPHAFLHFAQANAASAAFSPDGRWFLHNSNQSGRPEVYVRSFTNPGIVFPISSEGGIEGVWSRDGRHLFYRSSDATIVDVSVTTAPTFAVGPRRVMSNDKYALGTIAAGYDASPDGKRLLVVRSPMSHPEIIVAVNWLSEVRRRLGPKP